MNLKQVLLGLFVIGGLDTAIANEQIIQCKNAAGKLVFTDNVNNCANKKDTTQLAKINQNESFYNEIPDLLQTLNTADFAGDGQQFCAPVSVSNSLVWLEGNKDQQYQIDLVHKLSSPAYMNMNTTNGTSVMEVTKGVHKYANERWGRYKNLEYSGWSKVQPEFRSLLKKPTIDWMIQPLHRKGAAWINLGWYKQEGGNYIRTGGHWVTLVGYERGKLVIHDPASRSGKKFSNQFVSVRMLQAGQLISGSRKTSATNHFAITDGMKISSKANIAIIDGVVKFELN